MKNIPSAFLNWSSSPLQCSSSCLSFHFISYHDTDCLSFISKLP
jgi:hypothetical protein